jgi:hypothetical protein
MGSIVKSRETYAQEVCVSEIGYAIMCVPLPHQLITQGWSNMLLGVGLMPPV